MEITRAGPDEIRFPPQRQREADIIASFLPAVREKARELLGWQGKHSVRVVLPGGAPRVRDVIRIDTSGVAYWGTLLGALLVLGFLYAKLIGVLAGSAIALLLATWGASLLVVRRAWSFVRGLTVYYSAGRGGAVILMNLAPLPLPSEIAALRYELIALRDRYRTARIPAWLDEGVAFWFAEEVAGVQYWRPESRACVGEPEPRWDPRWRMVRGATSRTAYYRLAARYYWEVRRLAQAGRIGELLATPLKQTRSLRPSPEQVRAGWR
jgi:hypothetical protein